MVGPLAKNYQKGKSESRKKEKYFSGHRCRKPNRHPKTPDGDRLNLKMRIAGFSSKEVHPASGLVYYLYRYYEPNLQRWLNRDPLGERGGRNLYALVGNRPT